MWPIVFSFACTAAIFFSFSTEVAISPVRQAVPKTPPTSLKLGDKIAIVCDHTCVEQAQAMRATLEAFRLHADLYRLVQRWQADDFFGKRAKDYEYVVICCHGSINPKLRIKFEVIEPKKDNPELGDMVDYEINADNVATRLIGFQGVIVSMACESGGEPLAAAFLKAGCKAYLGPIGYSDDSSGLIYAQSFFYFMQYHWRQPAPVKWTIQEAADAAQHLDPRAKFGTKIWRCYERK